MLLHDAVLVPTGISTCGHMSRKRHMQLRAAALVAVAAAYVGIRQTVSAGEQLVAIYRKVGDVLDGATSRDPLHCLLQCARLPVVWQSVLDMYNDSRWRTRYPLPAAA
jgi:hypothetical protein